MIKYKQITTEERYIIARLKKQRLSLSKIADVLGRHPSSISREVRRNIRSDGSYSGEKAQENTNGRRRRTRKVRQYTEEEFAQVLRLLKCKWSPEQISNILRIYGVLSISHETIYRYIRRNKREGGKWWRQLRHSRKNCRKRYRSRDNRGVMSGKRPIADRPRAAENRSRLGHYEIDTVLGKGSRHCILTLVDRKTGYLFIRKLNSRTTSEANTALEVLFKDKHFRAKTITADNGTEFHHFKEVEDISGVKFYFAQPYHSWERGSNENANGLIRQYLPKGKSMARLTQQKCDEIAKELNQRPRKRYDYRTPEGLHVGIKRSLHF